MSEKNQIDRRQFLRATGAAAVGGALFSTPLAAQKPAGLQDALDAVAGRRKMRVALVGTGVRGAAMYGRQLLRGYGDHIDMVGVCDSNPGRLQYARGYIGTRAPAFTDLRQMLTRTRPEWLIVTTWDWEHHNNIIEGMRHGANIIVEKPITIDEQKAQQILDAQQQFGKQVVVTHNYRYSPHRGKLKELLMQGVIGDITTVEFHWHISHPHMQRYMQRWHGHRERSGSLWVHKSSHHFDLINWWLDSEPEEVFARGELVRFGEKGPFRGPKCRTCPHQAECPYYWDITQDEHLRRMYAENEHHDGYIRDNCVFRTSIDIHEKQAATVRYANGAYLNYSLTAESDYEGFWLAFNGTKGRVEGREGGRPGRQDHHEWTLLVRGQQPQVIRAAFEDGGHWGGDPILMDKLFKDPSAPDPLHQSAGTREGIMAILPGIAARKSVDTGVPVKIAGLTRLEPSAKRIRG
jgi:predicted dehydrogenase